MISVVQYSRLDLAVVAIKAKAVEAEVSTLRTNNRCSSLLTSRFALRLTDAAYKVDTKEEVNHCHIRAPQEWRRAARPW